MGYSVSFEERQEITLPSFTYCPFNPMGTYEASSLKNLSAVLAEMPLTFEVTAGDNFW